MENKNQIFQVELENGDIVDAELRCVIEVDGKSYAVYQFVDEKGQLVTCASSVTKDEEGYDQLEDITDPEDKEKILKIAKAYLF